MARLHAEAERRHTSVEAVIEEWATSLPTKDQPVKHHQPSFVAMGSSNSGRRASEAEALVSRIRNDGTGEAIG